MAASVEFSPAGAKSPHPVEARAQAERARREVQARFQSAFENAPTGMALTDREGRWLAVNAALFRGTADARR